MGYSNGYSGMGDYGPDEDFMYRQRQMTDMNNARRDFSMESMGVPSGVPLPVPSLQQQALGSIHQLNSTMGAEKQRNFQNIFDSQYRPRDKREMAAAQVLPLFNTMFEDGAGVNVSADAAHQLATKSVSQGQDTRRQMDAKQMMMLQTLDQIVNAFGKAGPDDVAAFKTADIRSRVFNDFTQKATERIQRQEMMDQARIGALLGSYGHNRPGSSGIPSAMVGDGPQGTAAHAAFLASRGIQEYGPEARNSWEAIDMAKKKEQANLDMQYQQEMSKINALLNMGLVQNARQQTFANQLDATKVAANAMGLGPAAQAAEAKAAATPNKPTTLDVAEFKAQQDFYDDKVKTVNKQIEALLHSGAASTKKGKEELTMMRKQLIELERERDAHLPRGGEKDLMAQAKASAGAADAAEPVALPKGWEQMTPESVKEIPDPRVRLAIAQAHKNKKK